MSQKENSFKCSGNSLLFNCIKFLIRNYIKKSDYRTKKERFRSPYFLLTFFLREHFKKIFSPGFTSKKRGWGLGLSLAKRIIVDYHKGKISVKSSELDKGTTFEIVLKKH